MKQRILIIGDSFVEGVGAEGKFGWAQRFQEEVRERYNVELSGVGGDNIKKILSRHGNYLGKKFDLVVLQVGLNDSRYRPSLNANEVPLLNFKDGILEFVGSWRKAGSSVVLIGLTRVDETKTTPYKEDKIYGNECIEEYDAAIRMIAESEGVPYLEAPSLVTAQGCLDDGLHPSDIGHKQLFQALSKAIQDQVPTK